MEEILAFKFQNLVEQFHCTAFPKLYYHKDFPCTASPT